MKLMCGLDPGTTVGIACVDTDGNAVLIHSEKGLSVSDAVALVSKFGTPIVVATDKAHVPEKVQKFAAAFHARVWSPEKDMMTAEKNDLAKDRGTSNDHERDAMAAAVKSWEHVLPKLQRAKKLAEERKEEILTAALKEVRIADAVQKAVTVEEKQEVLKRRQSAEEERLKIQVKNLEDRLAERDRYARALEAERDSASEKAQKLARQIASGPRKSEGDRIRELHSNLHAKQKELDRAERTYKELKALLAHVAGGELEILPAEAKGYETVKNLGDGVVIAKKNEEDRKTLDADDVEELITSYRRK
ncbi:MAG: DUF460 domain-containing protein [Candidatus Diapherotrites archaeon]|nr:DUF460 domain-containing protein [Candidatus Diapherotrites archaeon]